MKPPLTTVMHWVSQALFGHSMMAIRALDLGAATLAALGLVEIGRQLHRTPVFGIAAAIGFATLYYSYGYWEHAQTDGWAGFLLIPAVVLMLKAWACPNGRSRFLAMLGSGAILGVAFCFKYTIGGAGVLVFTPLAVNFLGKDEARFYFTDFLACFFGGAVALFVVMMTLATYGAWDDFIEIQRYVMSYVGYKGSDARSPLIGFQLPGMISVYLLVCVGVGLMLMVFDWIRNRRALVLVVAVLWIFSGWLSGAAQGKGFAYHFLPLVPAYAILIGFTVEYICHRTSGRAFSNAVAFSLLLGLYFPSQAATENMSGVRALRAANGDAVYVGNLVPFSDFDILETLEFAQTLKKHHGPDDTLFVWGFETMLYFLAETPPRYKFPYAWPFMVAHNDGRYDSDLLNRLKTVPPTHFVVQLQDATPWATGNPRSSEGQLQHFPELLAFLNENYSQIEEHSRFKLFQLKRDR
ncbi:glycosyltransferase family 39 protein [Aliiroseovarius halocynthiae]|uniref:glycosyltransferase family 39 protein n=1 Tax=Aliiroseovarius halocynthiae TaxID=985055 RepID=UPI0024822B75|nr:glycosyltransferase family 39 protein [Aliiroseovarius halocynthiae]